MDLGLTGRSTIITGGSGGIGRGLVLGFAEEGANVVIATRDAAKAQEVADAARELPGDAIVVATDVTNEDAVEAMTETAEKTFGPIDVLVNNAGGVYYPKKFLEKTREEAEWEQQRQRAGQKGTRSLSAVHAPSNRSAQICSRDR